MIRGLSEFRFRRVINLDRAIRGRQGVLEACYRGFGLQDLLLLFRKV